MDAPAGLSRLSLALFSLVLLAAYGTSVAADGTMRRGPTTPAPTRSAAPIETPEKSLPPRKPAKRRKAPERAAPVGAAEAFAHVGGVALVHPAERIETVAFHQASDVATLELTPAKSAVRAKVLPSRQRPTSRSSAADIVVDAESKIRAPVSGVVKRAGDYRLYCKYPDAFTVISPDGHPELEVKVLHISGLRVRPGDRIVAGKTPIAGRATKFPFRSQVDAFAGGPAWPHVHIEVTKLGVPSATPVAGPSTLAFGC